MDPRIQVVATHPVEATFYDWKWYYPLPGYTIWLILILALVLPRTNRDFRVLLIFVPLIFVNLEGLFLKLITKMSSESAVQFGIVVQSMAIGTAVLWLIAEYFKRFRGFFKFLLSFTTLVLVGISGTLSYWMEFSNETLLFIVIIVFLTGTLLTALVLGRRMCRWKYNPKRFMAWLALWTFVISMVGVLGIGIAGGFIMSSNPSFPQLPEVLMIMFFVGPVYGLGLFLLNLPFMILGFVSPFFRERLINCLALKQFEKISTLSEAESADGM